MNIPTFSYAQQLLAEAEVLNPGPWVAHSIYVAKAAEIIAAHHPRLDPETASILGTLHDIGRRFGVTDMRHILDGYHFMREQGFPAVAQICLTHSFPVLKRESAAGKWDCTEKELQFVEQFLARVELDEYDYLIQLCDALALPSGFTLIEKRLVDVTLRHGFNEYSLQRWQAFLGLKMWFEKEIGQSIYQLLPGIVESILNFQSEKTMLIPAVHRPNV
ncbi:MAG: HD domain-containing protein [Ardenticatenaceae bacterium]|nr:HD domain-containing protein [Ardenticatenaceae bacterium]